MALAANAVHKLWKWQRNERNTTGKVTSIYYTWLCVHVIMLMFIRLLKQVFLIQATASIQPQLWQPSSGILMTNDISDTNPEDAVSCFALSKNDSYVMSASGGKISLFNMMTFKVCRGFHFGCSCILII